MNYTGLFYATLPETVLEVAALLVLVVDLGFLRKAVLKTRLVLAAVLGIAGCAVALWAVSIAPSFGAGSNLLLAAGGSAGVAQCAILILTALTLLLLIDSAQDLLVIFTGLELLSLGLYILTAFNKQSGKSAEAAMKYYLFGGMSAAFLLFGFSYLYGLSGTTNLALIQNRITLAGPNP